jgi:hypothetical protein
LLSLIALLGCARTAAATTTANLLTDGGFEAGGVGWQTLAAGGAVVNIANYTGAGARDGTHFEEANTSVDGGSIYQDIPVSMATNQSATFSIWARVAPGVTAGGQHVNLCLWALTTPNTPACQDRTLTNTWQQLEATMTVPGATTTLRAQLYMYGPGTNFDFDGGVVSANLLTDGGFEAGGAGWHTLASGGGIVNIANDGGAGAHDGARFEEANTSTPGGSIYQDVPVSMTAGQSATLSMWVRLAAGVAASGQTVGLCLWALTTPNTSACHTKALTGAWQQLQTTVTAPAATSVLRAQVYMYPTQTNIDFDGATLTPNLLADGGFEAGGAGWQTLAAGGGIVNIASYKGASAHDGTRFEEANTSVDGGSIYQDVPVSLTTDQSATFSIWARVAPGVGVHGQHLNLCLWALTTPNTPACQNRALTNTWQELQATLTVPAPTSTLRAQLYMYGTQSNFDFDGASLGAPQTADEFYVPQSTAAPTVSGSPAVGGALTCSPGSWSNDPTAFAYAWDQDGNAIAGAMSAAYTIGAASVGHGLTCSVTASNPAGSATAASSVVPVPVATQLPTRHRRRALMVKIREVWTFDHAWTKLIRIWVVGRLPRRAAITITCTGRRCPHRVREAAGRHVRPLLRSLAGSRYHAGARILIVVTAPGRLPERGEFVIRNGRVPAVRVL